MSRSFKENAQGVLMSLSMAVRESLDRSNHRTDGVAIPLDRGFTTSVADLGDVLFLFDIEDEAVKLAGIVYSNNGRLEALSRPRPLWQGGNVIVDACFDAAKEGIEKVVREWN